MTWKPARHGRDHCPQGSDPIPCLTDPAWARRSKGFDAANQLISNNAVATVTFNHDYNMAAGQSGSGFYEASGNGIKLLQAGVIAITAEVFWFEGFTTTAAIGVSDSVASGQHWNSFPHVSFTTPSYVVSFVHNYPVNTVLTLVVYQSSGSDKNVDAGYLHLHYLGGYTGTEFSAMNPDQ